MIVLFVALYYHMSDGCKAQTVGSWHNAILLETRESGYISLDWRVYYKNQADIGKDGRYYGSNALTRTLGRFSHPEEALADEGSS